MVDLAWDGEPAIWSSRDDETCNECAIEPNPYFVLENNVLENELPAAIDQIAVANIDVDQYEPTLKAQRGSAPKSRWEG